VSTGGFPTLVHAQREVGSGSQADIRIVARRSAMRSLRDVQDTQVFLASYDRCWVICVTLNAARDVNVIGNPDRSLFVRERATQGHSETLLLVQEPDLRVEIGS
jgi:hypothetical protein